MLFNHFEVYFFRDSLYSKYLQAMLKIIPWIQFVIIFVFNPRKNNPLYPSLETTSLNASLYVICFYDVCFIVFITLIEFDIVSDTNVQQNPINAPRARAFNFSSLKLYLGM